MDLEIYEEGCIKSNPKINKSQNPKIYLPAWLHK